MKKKINSALSITFMSKKWHQTSIAGSGPLIWEDWEMDEGEGPGLEIQKTSDTDLGILYKASILFGDERISGHHENELETALDSLEEQLYLLEPLFT